jgi:hypothetical protein
LCYFDFRAVFKTQQKMTIPSRPAPPPPNKNIMNHHNNSSSTSMVNSFVNNKKAAPPRPPPPTKAMAPLAPVKKSGILSNLFGSSNKNKVTETTTQIKVPPKLPAPPAIMRSHSNSSNQFQLQQQQQQISSIHPDLQLINFGDTNSYSPPPSIKKTPTGGSDSVSIDSFCSSNSSPNNFGAVSQSERCVENLN